MRKNDQSEYRRKEEREKEKPYGNMPFLSLSLFPWWLKTTAFFSFKLGFSFTFFPSNIKRKPSQQKCKENKSKSKKNISIKEKYLSE